MDSKNVISLVVGLIIGAVAVWLVMAFTGVGSTFITSKQTVSPTATPISTANTVKANSTTKFATDKGDKTYDELTAAYASWQQQGSETVEFPNQTDHGDCYWKPNGDGTSTCSSHRCAGTNYCWGRQDPHDPNHNLCTCVSH